MPEASEIVSWSTKKNIENSELHTQEVVCHILKYQEDIPLSGVPYH